MRGKRKQKARKSDANIGQLEHGSSIKESPVNASNSNSTKRMSKLRKKMKRLRRKFHTKGSWRTVNTSQIAKESDEQHGVRYKNPSSSQTESKQIILKLLGDKSSTSLRCCDEEANILQDMDLMILGSSPEKYKRYAGLLRLEYSHMNDAEYKQMRLKNFNKERPATSTPVEGITTNTTIPTTQINLKDVLNNSKKKKKRNRKKFLTTKSPNSSLNSSSTVSQIITRRLLRSIRRRQNPQNVATQSQCVAPTTMRKLNFSNNENALKGNCNNNEITLKNVSHLTLEEGEILSEEDDFDAISSTQKDKINTDNVDRNTNANDDDCICIEPFVELITIEDETETEPVSSLRSAKESSNLVITSTPQEKPKTSFSTLASLLRNKIPEEENATEESTKEERPPLFYIDNAQGKWLDTIISDDTFADYSKFSLLQHAKDKKRRRSERLKEKRLNKYFPVDDADNSSNDVIVMEDSTLKLQSTTSPHGTPSEKATTQENDDSVIFVSESKPVSELRGFIPLESSEVPNPIHVVPNPMTPKPKRPRNSLFTKSEKKQLSEYNNNAYNPCSDKNVPASGKRMVIIDGSNVAFSHALNKEFSVKGLKICLDYFEKMGHEVKAVVPQFRLGKYKSSSPDELNTLHGVGKIVFTPCKNLPGAKSISYDDRFILQLACELDAAIVSNDNYRDLINENSAFKKIIEQRVIGYTWCNDIFILPKDPYGKWGPPLHTILNRS